MSNIRPTESTSVDKSPARPSLRNRVHGAIRTAPSSGGSGDGATASKELTTKRLLRFGVAILALMLLSLGIAYTTSEKQDTALEDVHNASRAAQSIEQSITDSQAMIVGYYGVILGLTTGDAAVLETSSVSGRDALVSFEEHFAEVSAFIGDNDGKEQVDTALAIFGGLKVALTGFFDAPSVESLTSEARAEGATAFEALRVSQEELSDIIEEQGNVETSGAIDSARKSVLMVVLASLLAIAAFIWVGRNVHKSVANMRTLQSETDRMSAEATVAQDRERLAAGELQHKVDSMLATVALAAATGDLTAKVDVSGTDAIGQMGDALTKLLSMLRSSVATIAGNSDALAAAAEELQVVSGQMGVNSAETSKQVMLVTSASIEVTRNVETVAAGAEEMAASIKEIARNTSAAAKVAAEAVEAAGVTNATVGRLGESSAEIDQIVKVITGIAQQTNLLALNATIEAARAGEAGKGFAVVANEVKELAKETAKATEDISARIETIQTETRMSVESITGIVSIIDQIAEFQNTIASAVEQQAATTSEMARSVSDASGGSAEIAANMQNVSSAADSTASGASDSQGAASELARMASELKTLVGQFTY